VNRGSRDRVVRMTSAKAVRLVAILEASKGLLVLVAATGLLSLIHHDLRAVAVALIEHLHLNPAAKYPHIFLDAASALGNSRLILLALGAAAYSTVRFVEAYGLFYERAWAELFAAGSGSVYVPFELAELMLRPTWYGIALLLLNLAVVAVMLWALWVRRRNNARGSTV